MNKQISYERYHRQLILKDFGEAAQQKLLEAKVLVIGAGGLGCPALLYLAAAGVGTIGVVDDDVVTLSNLHRQILYSVDDVGKAKATQAVSKLQHLNPDCDFLDFRRISPVNAADIVSNYDIVLDGSDNFATKYLVNDTCVLLNKILVYGAVSQYEGQVAIFNCRTDSNKRPVNYRDLFPQPPNDNEILNCEEAGVLGVLPGIIGSMMANETIKLITGIGQPLIDKLITYDARSNQLYEIELSVNEQSSSMIPEDMQALGKMDYELFCSAKSEFEINGEFFDELLQAKNVEIVDVREKSELPIVDQFQYRSIPLVQLQNSTDQLRADTIVLFCQSGKRSLQGAKDLHNLFGGSKKIFSLKGGIVQWLGQQREGIIHNRPLTGRIDVD
jgi:sulfur-carrier protein adenylyltransferase/sulfurtransferase